MIFWTVLFLMFVAGWDLGWYAAGVRSMFPWQLKRHLAESMPGALLVDVRTPGEYRLFHMAGAQLRPDLLSHPEALEQNDPKAPVVVICMTGHRSPVVAYQLQKLGLQHVYNLTWGMVGWKLFGGKTLTGDPPL